MIKISLPQFDFQNKQDIEIMTFALSFRVELWLITDISVFAYSVTNYDSAYNSGKYIGQ